MIELFEIHKVNGTNMKIARFKPEYLLTMKDLKKMKKKLEKDYGCDIMCFYREIPDEEFDAYINTKSIGKRKKSSVAHDNFSVV